MTIKSARSRSLFLCVASLCGVAGNSIAQDASRAELEERVVLLEELLDEHLAGEEEDLGMVASYEDVRATFQIFGDVGASYHQPETSANDHTDFAFGSLAFVVNAGFGDHFRVLSETVIHGKTDDAIGFSQERLWLSWIASDQFYAKFGTEHSAISRWNNLYHHGKWLEPTIMRPDLARFEGGGGILPLHRTGINVGGSANTESMRVEYFGTVSNGRGETPLDKQRTEDADDHKAFDIGVAVEPAFLPGFRAGVALVKDEIPPDPASTDPMRMRSMSEGIATAHMEYQAGRVRVDWEYAFIQHEANSSGDEFDSNSAYLQGSYALDGWTPYARFDYRNMAEGDPFYSPHGRDLDRWVQYVGTRWDPHPNVAVKVEVGVGRQDQVVAGNTAGADYYEGQVQLSWWF